MRRSMNRVRHLPTVALLTPRRPAIALFGSPSALANNSQTFTFGYRSASPYTGKDLIYSKGALARDPYNGSKTYRAPSTLNGGSSGGPWISGFNPLTGTGTVFSVNSYSYAGQKFTHGPILGGTAQKMLVAVQTSKGNVRF